MKMKPILNFLAFMFLSFIITATGHEKDLFNEDDPWYYIKDIPSFSHEIRKSAISEDEKVDSKDIQSGPQITVNIIIENSPKMFKNVEHEEKIPRIDRIKTKHGHYSQKSEHFQPHHFNKNTFKNVRNGSTFNKSLTNNSRFSLESHNKGGLALVRKHDRRPDSTSDSGENGKVLHFSYQIDKNGSAFIDKETNTVGKNHHSHENDHINKATNEDLNSTLDIPKDIDNYLRSYEKPEIDEVSLTENNTGLVHEAAKHGISNTEFDTGYKNEIGINDIEFQNQTQLNGGSQMEVIRKARSNNPFLDHMAPMAHQVFHPFFKNLFKREIIIHGDSDSMKNISKQDLTELSVNRTEDLKESQTNQPQKAANQLKTAITETDKDKMEIKQIDLKDVKEMPEVNQDIFNNSLSLEPHVSKPKTDKLPKILDSEIVYPHFSLVSEIKKTTVETTKGQEEPKILMSVESKKLPTNVSALTKGTVLTPDEEFDLQKRRLPLLIAPPIQKTEVKTQPDFPGVWNRVLPYLAVLKRNANNSELHSNSAKNESKK